MVHPESEKLPDYDFPVMFPCVREVAEVLAERKAGVIRFGRSPRGGIPPAAREGHYANDYKWDNAFSAILLAKQGHIKEAMEVLFAIVTTQRPDGMIPNITYAPKAGFSLEQLTFPGRKQSAYSQPTLEAIALKEIIDAAQTYEIPQATIDTYTHGVFPYLAAQADYFMDDRVRRIDKDLVGLIHSNENGQDSSPAFDYLKILRAPRRGPDTPKALDYYNTVADIAGMALLSIRNRLNGWRTAEIFDYFCHLDPMMNVLFVNELRTMSEIADEQGDHKSAQLYRKHAYKIEEAILNDLWDPTARNHQGAFRAYKNPQGKGTLLAPGIHVPPLRKTGFVDADTVSCIFPIMLDNLPKIHLERLVEIIEDYYSSPFMLPSTATDSPEYDPHMNQKLMWRGPVWAWMNFLIGSGIDKQIQRLRSNSFDSVHDEILLTKLLRLREKIQKSSNQLNKRADFAENHDSETGEGLRTKPFAGAAVHELVADGVWLAAKRRLPARDKRH